MGMVDLVKMKALIWSGEVRAAVCSMHWCTPGHTAAPCGHGCCGAATEREDMEKRISRHRQLVSWQHG